MYSNNPSLDFVNINAYREFGEIVSIYSEDIERKRNYDGRTDERTDGMTNNLNPAHSPLFQSGAITIPQIHSNEIRVYVVDWCREPLTC